MDRDEARKYAYRAIIEQVAEMIARGELSLGDRLPAERRLAERLGVSRGALRQAFQILAELGCIERRQGDGTYLVAAFSADPAGDALVGAIGEHGGRLHEILEFRQMIEPQIAALAARRISADMLDRLKILICDQQRALLAGEKTDSLDAGFHRLLAEAAGNRILCQIMVTIQSILNQSRSGWLQTPERGLASVAGHLRILDALVRQDPEGAAQAMTRHLREIESAIFSDPRRLG